MFSKRKDQKYRDLDAGYNVNLLIFLSSVSIVALIKLAMILE